MANKLLLVAVMVAAVVLVVFVLGDRIAANDAAAAQAQIAVEQQRSAQAQAYAQASTERLQTVAITATALTAMVLGKDTLQMWLVVGLLAVGLVLWLRSRA